MHEKGALERGPLSNDWSLQTSEGSLFCDSRNYLVAYSSKSLNGIVCCIRHRPGRNWGVNPKGTGFFFNFVKTCFLLIFCEVLLYLNTH